MESQKKVKLIISLAILIAVALFTVIVFQLVNITKVNKQLKNQQQQIQELQEELDYYNNKSPENDYEVIT